MSFQVSSGRRPMSRRMLRVFSTFLVLFSAAFTGLYGWFAWDMATNAVEVDAVVVEREVDEDPVGLVVEFTTESGELVRTDFTEFSGDHRAGDELRVRYVPRDPRIARQADEPVAQPVFLVVGGMFLILSLGLSVYAWRFAQPRTGRQDPAGTA